VAKADLWWHDREEVLGYYSSGEYAAAIRAADSGVPHSVLPYCSVTHKFYDWVHIDGSFDDTARMRADVHFLKQLTAMS
jgi:hypothetical protein